MKKFYIILSIAVCAFAAKAQYTLTGSTYIQNFDGLNTTATAWPTGWFGNTGATSTSLGTAGKAYPAADKGTYWDTVDCVSYIVGGAFKSSASADSAKDTSTCAEQQAFPDRAFSVRQSSSFGDPGAAFEFELSNTSGYKSFAIAFELQGLDILSSRTTTWTVDYGIGASPTTFTPVTPTSGTMTTGGNAWTNSPIVVNFGSALDNQSTPVWIRIVALTATTGAGSRTTTAIDNFVMTYTPTGIETLQAGQVNFKVLGAPTPMNINFTCAVSTPGVYTLSMYDITGRKVSTQQVNLNPGAAATVSLNNANVVPGMYIARITNGSVEGITKVLVQ